MNLSNLKYADGSRHKRKRVGRGSGSGHGKTATRGSNGQMSRSGASHKRAFEGGQMPIQRRIPKYGFTSPFKQVNQVINLYQLQNALDDHGVTNMELKVQDLYKLGLISDVNKPIKVLGQGELKSSVTIEAHAFSDSAEEKITAAGGKAVKL